MSNFIVTIISGVLVAILVSWLGIGKDKTPVKFAGGFRVRRTGKWMIIISVILIIWGIILIVNNSNPAAGFNFNNPNSIYGLGLLEVGGILFVVGKIVAWFQKL